MQLPYSAREVYLDVVEVQVADEGCPGWRVSQNKETTGWKTTTEAATQGGIEYSTAVVHVEVERLHSHFVDKCASMPLFANACK